MVWPIAVVVTSIAMGAVLGLVAPGRGRLFDALRTFAIVSSVAVVVGNLIPHAWSLAGPKVLIAAAAAFVTPWLIERLGHEDPEHDHSSTMGLELSYWGLMLHKVGDGFAVGAFTAASDQGHHHGDVITAIAAHSVPMTALMTLAFTAAHGPRSGIRRAIGLAVAATVGVLIAQRISPGGWMRGEPWIEAVVSGLLLHVVTHDWAHEHERPALPGWPQVIAIAAGIGVLLLGR